MPAVAETWGATLGTVTLNSQGRFLERERTKDCWLLKLPVAEKVDASSPRKGI